MREILFRAKRINDGGWAYGQLLKIYNEYYIITKENQHICYCNCGTLEFCDVQEIDSDTIGQYTGLTDKNGKKIWENDIVDAGVVGSLRKLRYTVGYDDAYAAFWLFDSDGDPVEDLVIWSSGTQLKVIGNIFDNPDLLTTSSTDSD